MGRKAVNGYPEKSYYDNTVFNGVVATHDPLNEGSFALLTNFDIVDTGKSVIPRKGYTSTTFSIDGSSVVLSDKLFIFRDPNIQKEVIIDFNKLLDDETSKFAYSVDVTQYNLSGTMLLNAASITGYDYTNFLTYMKSAIPQLEGVETNPLAFLFTHSTIVGDSLLKPIRDRDGVIYYVGKMLYTNANASYYYWIKFLYREKQTIVGGVTYTADTLVIDYIDTQKQPTVITERNIASSKSILYVKDNFIRYQESVGEVDSQPSEINRPILLKYGNDYMTTKIPDTLRTGLDIKVEPTFYLQDPSKILVPSGTNPKWAYRFDFLSANTANPTIYKTPWRHLNSNPNSEEDNVVISPLKLDTNDSNDETYTYYIVSEGATSWHTTYNETSFLTPLSQAEEILYKRMRDNGVSGSSGTSLGNLAFAYLKHETIANTFKPESIQLNNIDTTVYDQMGFKFISEDDMRAAVTPTGNSLETLDARTTAFTAAEASDLVADNIYSTATAEEVKAPIFPMSYTAYNSMKKMNVNEFIAHANLKDAAYKIRVVFVPFVYRRAGVDASTSTSFDNVYICSLGGIYVNGLKQYMNLVVGDIASFHDVVSVKKDFTISETETENFVDCFKNLNDLYLSDAVKYIPRNVFDVGVYLILYLKPYNDTMLDTYAGYTTAEKRLINKSWDESAYKQSSAATWASEKDVVYLDEIDDDNPSEIAQATQHIIFEDRLVIWRGNKVYISEEGDYYYFKNVMKKIFPEEILKVVTFKNILLVFTTQNLYAIYREEIDTFTGSYSEQGLPEFIKSTVWLQQPVLYNINPDRKYLDVIQVYNQMILFYSNEGQLYMIKPSTMIDSETQFGIQYFNKSANDILANYEQYINERLMLYGKLDREDETNYVTKADVQVKALVDIDLIKIFYTVPGRITFILIYDVVNNRYTTYDTLSFTSINFVKHVEGGECYLTTENNTSYFTLPVIGINQTDQNVDMHYIRMFKKEPIFTFIDSGNLNLNNHLRKRLRDLRIVLKNLDATKILYNAELILDDTIIRPFYGDGFRVRMMNGPDSTMVVNKVPTEDLNELFGLHETIGIEGARTDLNSYYLHEDADFYNRNSLLKTETLNSSRLIEYNSSILGLGKVIRIRLQFIAKGKYKLQSFGIVYKERRI